MDEKYCVHCETNHLLTREFWIEETRSDMTRPALRCRLHRNYMRWRRANLGTFQDYLNVPIRKIKAQNKCSPPSEEEKKLRKRIYDQNRRASYSLDDRKKLKEANRRYLQSDKGKAYIKKNNARRTATPHGRISQSVRAGIHAWIKGKAKGGLRYLPYSAEELKKHLESKFTSEMSWANYGTNGWEIDHIVPLRFRNPDGSFYWDPAALGNPISDTFQRAWALSNLQPLWNTANSSKGNRFIS